MPPDPAPFVGRMNAAGTAGNKGSHRRICRAGSPRAPQAGCGRGEERMNKHLARILVALTAAAMTVSQPIAGYATGTDSSINVSATRTYEFKVGDAVKFRKTVTSGSKLEKPEDPTEEGKKFDGWYVTENGEERPFNFDEELSFTDSSTITLTAKFTEASATRTYEFKVGDAVTSSETVTSGSKLGKPEDPAAEDGKSFDGWYTEDGGEFDFDAALTFTDSSTITLTARFSDAANEKTDKVKALYERLINAKTADELQKIENSLSDEEEKLMASFTSEQQDALKALSEKLGLYGTNATVDEKTYEVEVGSTITITGVSNNTYRNHWSSDKKDVAKISGSEWGTTVTVEGVKEGTATITHTYKQADFWKEYTETFKVTVKAASSTVKVYVYVASKGFSDEMYKLLGIDKTTLDGNNYFPAGSIEVQKSFFNGKSTTPGDGLISDEDEWGNLKIALGALNTDALDATKQPTLKDGKWQNVDYTVNRGNKVGDYLSQAVIEYGAGWGSQSTALFPWHVTATWGTRTQHYGFTDQSVRYHLDLKFDTRTITFITGNNGITDGTAKDGTEVDSRTYITGSTIQEPRNLKIPDGYKLVGYYTSPNFEESTKWNGIGTPLNADQTVYIKIVPQDNVTLKYVVAQGEGTVSPGDESFNPTTGNWSGSRASADTGHTFAGWYADKECTQKLSDSGQYKPEKPTEGWTEGGTYIYYAKFIPSDKVLTIKKTLSGNMYDASKTFAFTISSDMDMKWTTAAGEQTGRSITVLLGKDKSTAENEATVWDIRIPAGAEVTVTEVTDGYTQTISGQPDGAVTVEGGIRFTMPSVDTTITFDNRKEIVPDTGVVLDTLPYVVILALVAAGAVIFIRKRGRRVDD